MQQEKMGTLLRSALLQLEPSLLAVGPMVVECHKLPQLLQLNAAVAHLQVYYLSRGKVKPANRAYAGVRNDYTINFDKE